MVTPATGRVVVSSGRPGSGKTTVGAAGSPRGSGVPFARHRRRHRGGGRPPISDIFVDDGEARFRALERAEVAARARRGTTACWRWAAGAVLDPAPRRLLAGHTVVFLDVGIADAARRIGFDREPPAAAVNPRAPWVRLMDERRADLRAASRPSRVDTAGRTPDAGRRRRSWPSAGAARA